MLVQVNQLRVCTLMSLRLATFCSLIRVQQIHFKQRNRHLHQRIATLKDVQVSALLHERFISFKRTRLSNRFRPEASELQE